VTLIFKHSLRFIRLAGLSQILFCLKRCVGGGGGGGDAAAVVTTADVGTSG
jgi:hypothetical protein